MCRNACFAGDPSAQNRLNDYGLWAGSTECANTRHALSSLRHFRKQFRREHRIHTPTWLDGPACGLGNLHCAMISSSTNWTTSGVYRKHAINHQIHRRILDLMNVMNKYYFYSHVDQGQPTELAIR